MEDFLIKTNNKQKRYILALFCVFFGFFAVIATLGAFKVNRSGLLASAAETLVYDEDLYPDFTEIPVGTAIRWNDTLFPVSLEDYNSSLNIRLYLVTSERPSGCTWLNYRPVPTTVFGDPGLYIDALVDDDDPLWANRCLYSYKNDSYNNSFEQYRTMTFVEPFVFMENMEVSTVERRIMSKMYLILNTNVVEVLGLGESVGPSDSDTTIVGEIVSILTAGLGSFASGIGAGLLALVTSIFVSEEGTLTLFGIVIIVFAGVSLAIGLSRLIVNWVTSLGGRSP